MRGVIQSPLYDDFIRPKIGEYKTELDLRHALDDIKDKASRESYKYLIEKIQSKFPQLEMTPTASKILFIPSGVEREGAILSIEPKSNCFYILFEEQRTYRVHSQSKIIEFKNGGRECEGDLEDLITSVIIPHIKTKLKTVLWGI